MGQPHRNKAIRLRLTNSILKDISNNIKRSKRRAKKYRNK
ncbi:hypothetical protein SAMN05216302_100160 [Nitrosomonas aestuarii]|uniref:Uncharacterized protein n=1 Tax=Nitrosomonas aestuarii TaxID=52441 RepID=A0A1I3X1V2_9PROT|nr:hypothetical protein SAMN05216302_100160 [Nitrosomonas aestuarii]